MAETGGAAGFRRWIIVALAAVVLTTGIYGIYVLVPRTGIGQLAGSPGAGGKKAGGVRPVPVAVAEAKAEDLPVYLEGLGFVDPLSTVTVTSRVDGQLLEVFFREGQMVKAGELLATIDPRPFQVQLLTGEGQLARDSALLENARLDLERNRRLFESHDISRQEVDTQEALVRQYEGAVKADRGAIESARLQLDYCRIVAPAGGRVGLRLVDAGNIVRASDAGGITTIVQIQPIAVTFTLPEGEIPRVLEKSRSGGKLEVEAWDRERRRKLAAGTLAAVDNRVDPSTGTVRLKASFSNDDEVLFPNQFVNARLLVDVLRGVTVVPAAAIQRGPQGTFVYVLKADRTVGVQPVEVGEIEAGRAAIASGLAPGERVVTDGTDRLRDEAAVEVKPPAARNGGAAGPGGADGRPPEGGPGDRRRPEAAGTSQDR